VEAVEQSRAWATSEALRQEIVRESIGVYENLIQAAASPWRCEPSNVPAPNASPT